jgi:hypothetical protein
MDTLGIEPRASRMLSGCDTTTPCALETRTPCNISAPDESTSTVQQHDQEEDKHTDQEDDHDEMKKTRKKTRARSRHRSMQTV